MNSSDTNESTLELDPGTNAAMDGLIREFSRNKSGDDESFLASLQAALDAPTPAAAPKVAANRFWKWALLGSAAACVAAVIYGTQFANGGKQSEAPVVASTVPPTPPTLVTAPTTAELKKSDSAFAVQVASASEGKPAGELAKNLAEPKAPASPLVAKSSIDIGGINLADASIGGEEAEGADEGQGSGKGKGAPPLIARTEIDGRGASSPQSEVASNSSPREQDASSRGAGGFAYGPAQGQGPNLRAPRRAGLSEPIQPAASLTSDKSFDGPPVLDQLVAQSDETRATTPAREERRKASYPVDDDERRREIHPDHTTNSERYSAAMENPFLSPTKAPLSTFSVDVDTASYSNLRRMLLGNQRVPSAAVRVEEMINYFNYSYPQPEGPHPFAVKVETASCPWAPTHRLVKIALKAKEIAREKRPAANLVFLCDVSGSMNSPDKLPLLVKNLKVLTNQLNGDDSVAIVVYAGNEGVALPPTSGGEKDRILQVLNKLSSGGSTNGGAGITRAYQIAQERFVKGGINRVVLCTDGDFNVGTTSNEALVNLVQEKSKGGVFLTVCGYGQGNLNDSMMESITGKGNGVYYYVDSEREGRKIFEDDIFGTLMTVAKDVKIQVEFNPGKIGHYRLIGYNNRMLKKEDFANDQVDAGDVGAGHTVTALYEVIPPGVAEKPAEGLKYQQPQPVVNEQPKPAGADNPESLTVKLRYKEPEGTESKLMEFPHTDAGQNMAEASSDFKFAASVAEFGEWMRGKRVNGRDPARIIDQAEGARGNDPHGLRAEFIELVRKASHLRRY